MYLNCIDKIEIGEDARISIFEKLKSCYSRDRLKSKRGVNQSDVIKLLENLEEETPTKGIDFLDARPVPSGYEIDCTSAGRDRSPREMIEYIKNAFLSIRRLL